ncbi:hypothetical protein NP233_g12041 [Leucocoprinus birnbaumii]|uniref:Magnesium-dependent phosphatase-1 n=1 Tax=Leucocoprinus birnbaumii TaxID=56174 RepID=A0AAD5YNE4_9AGAR|nr:hypothetical protein NP233_g12041 [Leucocoprinus birnbaumii]
MSLDPVYPQLVAFDLDYTLWDLWIDTHVRGPLHRNGSKTNEVLDRAYQALRLLLVPPQPGDKKLKDAIPAIEFFHQLEIYPGSKLTHFKKLHKKTGIPYNQMLFFDDEYRNKEVESLGVTFQLVSSAGTTNKLFEKGLEVWRKRHQAEEGEREGEHGEE